VNAALETLDTSRSDRNEGRVVHIDAIHAVTSRERSFAQVLVALAGSLGVGLLLPVAILLVGLPVALAVRGMMEAIGWLAR
jgi:hypothetical protein